MTTAGEYIAEMRYLGILPIILCTSVAFSGPQQQVTLWPGGAPGALGTSKFDVPVLTIHFPDPKIATGAAFVICPGGAYGGLSQEAVDYAKWLSENGVVGIVLWYRLGSHGYRHPIMLQDAARAVRLTRSKAAEWKIDPKKIGIMGSSAGGHLASVLLTHFDAGNPDSADTIERESSRPDLGILCYAVVIMDEKTTASSRRNLLGENPSKELMDSVSNEKHVSKQTPPCFIWHTWEDTGVPLENSVAFAAALRAKGVPFELHVYEKGGHRMRLQEPRHRWSDDCLAWLRERGYAATAPSIAPSAAPTTAPSAAP